MNYLISIAILVGMIVIVSCNRKTAKKVSKTDALQVPTPTPTPTPPKSTIALDGQDHGLVMISIERSPCRGKNPCPWYSAKIYEDGAIFYHGRKNVKLMGEQSAITNIPTINSLIRKAEGIGFFKIEFPSDSSRRMMDNPVIKLNLTVKVRSGNQVREISYLNDMPDVLNEFALELDKFLAEQHFKPLFESPEVVPEKVPTPDGLDHGTLKLTIERTPCYGSCPWYQASFYDDGTIFYNGKKDVPHLGKYTLKTTPAMVNALIKKAKAIEFAKMSPSYPIDSKRVIADLPENIIMVKDGRTSHRVAFRNEAPTELVSFLKEVDAVLMRLSFKEKQK